MKCTVQKSKSPVKNLVRQRYAEVFNSGVKGLKVVDLRADLDVLAKINPLSLQKFGPLSNTTMTELSWFVRIRGNKCISSIQLYIYINT
jgi:hypothetical protein